MAKPRCSTCRNCVITADQFLRLPPSVTVGKLLERLASDKRFRTHLLRVSSQRVWARCRLGRWGELKGKPARFVVSTLDRGAGADGTAVHCSDYMEARQWQS